LIHDYNLAPRDDKFSKKTPRTPIRAQLPLLSFDPGGVHQGDAARGVLGNSKPLTVTPFMGLVTNGLVKFLVLELCTLNVDIRHRLIDPLRNPPGGLVQDGHGCWHK